jgi:hypothetical protein|tara:strand:+ start:458 stop:940 length:483 start_codon:yes stop_codon:yes gene_type:complete
MVNIVDPAEIVKQIISNNLSASDTNNTASALVVNANDQKRVSANYYAGIIRTYVVADNISFTSYSARKRHDRVYRVQIDFIGFKTRNLMLSNVDRVREILEFYHSSNIRSFTPSTGFTNPFALMFEKSSKDLSRSRAESHHRYVIDVELTVLGKVRTTAL